MRTTRESDFIMGLRTWADLPCGFEDLKERDYTGGSKDGQWFDVRGIANFGSARSSTGIANQDSGDLSSPTGSAGASHSSGTSYGDNTEDASLSSYLMDGNVRAMLKKVTVNEGALKQAIQSLGGGEKGLKELTGYIMSWVREQHKGENWENFSLSQHLQKLQTSPPVTSSPALGYMANPSLGHVAHDTLTAQSSVEVYDPSQFYYQPCSKSRRLTDCEVDSSGRRSGVVYRDRGTVVDARGSVIPEEFQGIHELQQPVASQHEDLSRTLAATTRAARRSRIARQRQASLSRAASNVSSAVPSPCGLWSVAPPTLDSQQRTGMLFRPGAQMRASNVDMLTFLLQKELRPSDVGNLGRIILPKKEAEMHLPFLAVRDGVSLQMEDFDSGYRWNVKYRFWPNNKSRMYLLENTGEFVKSHHLQEGDRLILYRNQRGSYVLRGKKKVHSESRGGAQGLQQKIAHSLARGFPEAPKSEEVLKESDLEVGLQDRSCHKAVKAEPTTVLVGDDDPFFKEEVMHNIGSTFGLELPLQPLERFPSLNLDFPLDEIMVGISQG